jgi:hypothetical protein
MEVTINEQVSIMDQEDNLRILNYNECNNNSQEELKKVRGWVQEIDTNKVLFETFPFTEQYDTSEDINKVLGENVNEDWDVYYSVEGTLLRVFWYKDRWYISTNKKLNAFKSRWSSRCTKEFS